MNAPVHAAFASILSSICPPARKQPEVEGGYLCTVTYDGLMLDVYGDKECFGGFAIMGSKVDISGPMSPGAIREIEIMANDEMLRA